MSTAIHSAYVAHTLHTTSSSHNWRQRQLYGLSQLLSLHGQKLVQCLSEKRQPLHERHEQELALVLEDIARYYVHINKSKFPLELQQASGHDLVEQILPTGVSVLVVDCTNIIRFAFGALVANIAIGNTVVLTTSFPTRSTSSFWAVLKQELPKFLDPAAIHVVESLDLATLPSEKINLLTIYADDRGPYKSILEQPYSRFISTKRGYNFVVVDEGLKSWEEIVSQIQQSFDSVGLRPESTNAVFIRADEIAKVSTLDDSLRKAMPDGLSPGTGNGSTIQEKFVIGTTRLDITEISSSRETKVDVKKALEEAARAGVLLIIVYRTLDHAIDTLHDLPVKPTSLSLLAPFSKLNAEYFQRWTISEFFSLGEIPTATSLQSSNPPGVICRPEQFGQVRTSCTSARKTPSLVSLGAITAHVQAVMKKPADAPNQTDDFFKYMTRMIKRVAFGLTGSLVGLAAYLIYTHRLRK